MAEETRIIRIVVDSSKAVDGSAAATRAMEKLERSVGSMDVTLGRMEKGLASLGGMVKAQLALAIAELGARFIQMGKDAFSAASGLDELAEQSGVTARGLQALQYSAVQNGLKMEQLETSISKFSQKMGEAAGGSKEMIEALDNIGVKILGANGKLRDNEAILTDVARAIVGIDDPAKRAAAAVDFFGKAGTRMLPLLTELAKGVDSLAASADRSSAMISDSTIKRLDAVADRLERSKLEWRAFFAENIADAIGWLDKVDAAFKNSADATGAWLKQQAAAVGGWLTPMVDSFNIAGVRASAMFLEAFRALPEQLGKLFADAMNSAIGAVEYGMNAINRGIEEKAPWLGIKGNAITLPRVEGGGASLGDYTGRIAAAGDAAATAMQAAQLAARERNDRQALINRQAGMEGDENSARIGRLGGVSGPGISNPIVKGAGQGEADKIAKLVRDAGRDVAAATAYAEASERGARAVAELEMHFKALKSAQDAYGATADKNKDQVAALTAKIEEQLKATERLKNLKDFNLGTEELEKANVLLEAENGLINASVEVRARELAIIKLKQEVQAKGLDENNAAEKVAIDRRGEAITQNERLKAQGEELKKANELWTAPLKSALESIQRVGADAFEQMLTNGNFTFQSLGDTFKKIVIRMAAEFMALATIRPVMSVLVNAVAPGMASTLGFGGGGSTGFPGLGGVSIPGGGSGGGLGSANLPSWLGGGSISDFFGQTLYGGSPIAGPLQPGAASLGTSGGVTLGGALGGIGSIAGGAYSLANAKGNTAKTIGGIGQMAGGVMMMIPGMQVPGMIVSTLSTILPGLFGGGDEYQWAPLAGANVAYNWNSATGSYGTADTQQLGGKSIASQFSSVPTTLEGLYKRTGGKVNPAMAFNASIWNNQREGKTSAYVISPTQGSNQIGETSGDPSALISRMIGNVFTNMVTNGGLDGVSETLKKALRTREAYSVEEATALVELTTAYDNFGKGVNSAKPALDEITARFEKMTATAKLYGIALAPIEAEQAKQTKRTAQDFIDAMLDPLAVQMRALEDQRKDSLASAEYIRDNVEGVYVDIAKITEYWTNKRLDLETQYQQQSVGNLQALIRRLTYGDLAAATPTTTLAGTRGTYEATLAQARAGGSTARDNLAGFAETYAGAVRVSFASTAEGQALIDQIRRDLLEVVGSVAGGASQATGGSNDNAQSNALAGQFSELMGAFRSSQESNQRLQDQVAALTAQLARRA